MLMVQLVVQLDIPLKIYTEYYKPICAVTCHYICRSYTMATRDLPDVHSQARGHGHIYRGKYEWPWYN